jgi:hypothetical protein
MSLLLTLRLFIFELELRISHSTVQILSGRVKTETVMLDEVIEHDEHGVAMHRCVETFRSEFAEDLEIRAGLATRDENNPLVLIPVEELPIDIAISCLLHPLVGGENCTCCLSCL